VVRWDGEERMTEWVGNEHFDEDDMFAGMLYNDEIKKKRRSRGNGKKPIGSWFMFLFLLIVLFLVVRYIFS